MVGLLQRWYPIRLLEDGSLLLYAYDSQSNSLLFGIIFYAHFFPLWCSSFILPLYVLWCLITQQHLWLVAAYTGLLIWLYWPRETLKIIPYLQLIYFFEVPRYYQESSFRILEPQQHPQLSKVLELFNNIPWESNSKFAKTSPYASLKYKEIQLTPEAIIALTAYKPQKQYPCDVYCCFPHGFTSNGWGQLSFCPFFNDVRNCVSTVLYYFGHLIITYTSLLGNPHPVTAQAIETTLSKHRAISIITGGFEEASLMAYKVDRVFLLKRWGIFKMAGKYGAGLIPYFTFGENHLYKNVQGLMKVRQLLNKYSIPGTLCTGAFMWFPYRAMLHIVIGKRIIPEPQETVEHLKQRFVKDLLGLHQKFGQLYYKGDYAHLEVW